MIAFLQVSNISKEVVLLNAEAGFDYKSFKRSCDKKILEVNIKIIQGAVNNQHHLLIICSMTTIEIKLKKLIIV